MQRDKSLDIAKGIAIIFVMYGHLKYTEVDMDTMYCWIYSFHMPFFVYISGLLMRVNKDHRWHRILQKLKRIVVPYFFANVAGYIINRIFHIESHTIYQFIHGIVIGDNLASNLPTWYLMSYFWIFLFGLFVLPYIDDVKKLIVADIISMLLVFCVAYMPGIPDYFRIKGTLVLLPFFITAYLVKKMGIKISWWMSFLLLMVGFIAGRLNGIHSWRYITVGNGDVCIPYLYLIAAMTTCVAMIEICKYLSKYPMADIFATFGRYSMMILCTHWVLGNVLAQYMEYGMKLFVIVFVIESVLIGTGEMINRQRKQREARV